MPVRIVRQTEVPALLPMGECIDAMEDVLKTLAQGKAVLPLRSMVRMPDRPGLIGLMPAYLGAPECLGLKVVTVMPHNHGTDLDSHQGAVLIFEAEHGSLLAVIDGSAITGIRTAAVSGAATRTLAKPDANDLAILGTGVQAVTHLEAMCCVRPLRRVRVWSRSAEHVRRFAERESKRHGVNVEASRSAREAVEGASVICTTTAAAEPILMGDWIAPGAHINAVGACFPTTRELDTAAMRRARLFVDRRESCLNEAGDFLLAKKEGAIGDEHILGELGEVFLGRVPGRTSANDVTLFKSLGIAVEDLAAAHLIWRKAEATNAGTSIEFGGKSIAV